MTDREIVHLYNRIGFGASPGQLRAARKLTRANLVASLLRDPAPAARGGGDSPRDGMPPREEREMYGLRARWMRRMVGPDSWAAQERMMLFWHDHFACMPSRADLAAGYLEVLRGDALGNFRALLHGVATDAGMMRYLNANSIRRDAPNENFAREVLELFTVGLDGYTERDVSELARAFSGWALNGQERWFLRKGQLDTSRKTILGRSGRFTGREALDLLVDDPNTARHLTRKLWTYLTDATPGEATVARHAAALRGNGYAIAPWLAGILEDDAFYAEELLGARVKSPTDLLVGWCVHTGARLPEGTARFVNFARFNNEFLLAPPSVAGWPGGKAWITPSTLPSRMALAALSAGEVALSEQRFATFQGLAGFAAEAVARANGDRDLAAVMISDASAPADAVALGSHTRYQYG